MRMITDKMSAIFFLYGKTFKNRVKKALKKPITYVFVVLGILYLVIILKSFGVMFGQTGMEPESMLTAILTVIVFMTIPSNLISYSKRKGLIFKQSDIHFLFPGPISPKVILLYAHLRTVLMSFVLSVVMTAGGVVWFHMPAWKMLVYFLFSCIVENILEASMMILCYGNERMDKKQKGILQALMYALIGIFVLLGIAAYVREGAGFDVVLRYIHSPGIQMIPVVGWYIAFLHLLFMGPTAVNIAGALLFFVSVAVLFVMARRMKCTGEYYEDAIQFAEDYEIAREKSKKGEVAVVGRKKKYVNAQVSYKGSYAKAIFYRQLLEYKKNRFFIFGLYTAICLALGIGMAVLGYRGYFGNEKYVPFIILGVMAYVTFIFSSYPGKWGKELGSPYTYLMPDSSFHKLWYATLIEHLRALVDGCLLTLPVAVITGLPPVQTVLIIVIYICMQACKLYAEVMVEAFLGNLLGTVAKQFTRLFFEGLVIGIGIIGAVAGTLMVSVDVGFLALIILSALMTAGMMAIAAVNFEKMESW